MALDDYDPQFLDAGARWDVDPRLLKTIADIESSGNPNAFNKKSGAAGLMGFIPSTAKQYGVNPLDVGSSVDGAAQYLHKLLTQYNGDINTALHHYSGRNPNYGAMVAERYPTFTLAGQPAAAPAAPEPPDPQYAPQKNFQTPARVPNTLSDEGRFPVWAQPKPQPAATPQTEPPKPMADKFDPAKTEEAILNGTYQAAAPQFDPAATEQAVLEGKYQPAAVDNTGRPSGFAAMMDPALGEPAAPVLGIPALQHAGAGLVQGFRDIDRFADRADKYLADRFPAYRWLDEHMMGYEPGSRTPGLEAATEAYKQQHGDSWYASGGRLVGNVAPTLVVSGPAAAAGAAIRSAPYIGRIAGPALEGGIMGATGNLLTSEGKTPGDWASDAAQGFTLGGLIGGGMGGVKGVLASRAHPADQAIADRLGVRLSSGQASGGPLKALEDVTSYMPGSGAEKFAGQQRQQIADVISREMGMSAGAPITSTTLQAAERRIGKGIEDAAKRIDIPATPKLGLDLAQIGQDALQAGPQTQQAHSVQNLTRQLSNLFTNQGGNVGKVMPGAEFQRFIARGGPLDTAMNSSVPEVRRAGQAIREALLDAGQSAGVGSQQALADLSRARYQWKVSQTVGKSINRTAAGSEEMNLPGLAQSIRGEFNMGQTGPGHEMADLAKLISGPLRELKSSGTGRQMWFQNLLAHGLGPAGATAGFYAGMPIMHALGAAAAPLAMGATVGRALRYGIPGGDALLNRVLPAGGTNLLTERPAMSYSMPGVP